MVASDSLTPLDVCGSVEKVSGVALLELVELESHRVHRVVEGSVHSACAVLHCTSDRFLSR